MSAGFPKCGTTDLHKRLTRHPDLLTSVNKEPHYVTRGIYNIDVIDLVRRGAGDRSSRVRFKNSWCPAAYLNEGCFSQFHYSQEK